MAAHVSAANGSSCPWTSEEGVRRSYVRYKHTFNKGEKNKKRIVYLTCTKAININTHTPKRSSQTYRLSIVKHQATRSQRLLLNTTKVTEAGNRNGEVTIPLRFHIQSPGPCLSLHPGPRVRWRVGLAGAVDLFIRPGSPVENTQRYLCIL